MNKSELIKRVADEAQVTKKEAATVVEATFGVIGTALKNGDKVQVAGFGTFEVRERAARPGVNPKTKEKITIAASKSPVFKPATPLKEAVK